MSDDFNPSSFANRIVVGVDGSDSSVEALRYAARLSIALATPLTAVLVWAPPMPPPHGRHQDSPSKAAARALATTVAQAYREGPPPGLRSVLVRGHAASVLVTIGDVCVTLVVGRRGRGGFPDLLLGSAARACATHARCPVLIVPIRRDAGSA